MSRMLVVWCAALLLGTGHGCKSRNADWKPTHPVSGTLFVDGTPAEGVQITLNDLAGIDKNQPTISQAFTDKEGKFTLSTYEQGDGVPEGEYVLTFLWGQINPLSMQFGGPDKLKERYVDPAKSTFKVKVEKGKPVDLGRIELTTK
ncbi:MAG TPA: hypothetical protein VMP01_02740 [Pirellulaceae bacterium]|nr:hypothetical protein [Pirellulaceae bacterium]